MFVEKIVALIGDVPVQFEPLLYVFSLVISLWLIDGFFYLCRYLVTGGGR